METPIKNKRKSNFEILRIVAMLMIVAYHYAAHGVEKVKYGDVSLLDWAKGSFTNKAFTSFLMPGGEVGVALFFILTGYFLINKKKYSLTKIILESFYYGLFSLLLFAIISVCGYHIPYVDNSSMVTYLAKMLFNPATSGNWWFIASYVFLLLLSPSINEFIRKLK